MFPGPARSSLAVRNSPPRERAGPGNEARSKQSKHVRVPFWERGVASKNGNPGRSNSHQHHVAKHYVGEGRKTNELWVCCKTTGSHDCKPEHGNTTVLSSPTAPTTLELVDLTIELKSVSNWHSLGIYLRVPYHELNTIQASHTTDNQRCKNEMLACWLRMCKNPTWATVIEALDSMDEHRVADDIRKKYTMSTTITKGILLFAGW